MATSDPLPPQAVRVDINGASYTIRGEGSADDVRRVARLVDETMREVAQATGITDSLKVAVLAALQIADDLDRLKRQMSDLEERLSGTAENCVTMLDQFLGGQPSGSGGTSPS